MLVLLLKEMPTVAADVRLMPAANDGGRKWRRMSYGNGIATAMNGMTAMGRGQWQWTAQKQHDGDDRDGWRNNNGNRFRSGDSNGRCYGNMTTTMMMDGVTAT